MIKKYEIEDIIISALEELDGKLSKPTYRDKDQNEPIQTLYEVKVEKDENEDLIFTFKEDIFSKQTDKYRIKIEMI